MQKLILYLFVVPESTSIEWCFSETGLSTYAEMHFENWQISRSCYGTPHVYCKNRVSENHLKKFRKIFISKNFFFLWRTHQDETLSLVSLYHTGRKIFVSRRYHEKNMKNDENLQNSEVGTQKNIWKKMDFFRNRRNSSIMCPKYVIKPYKCVLHFSDYLVGSISWFWA